MAWETLFKALKERGLKGVQLVVSAAHEGLVNATEEAFLGAQWQECQAHFLRRAVEQVKAAEQKAFRADVRAVLHAPDRERAMDEMKLLRGRWEKKAAKGVAYLEEHLDSLLAVLNFPESHHKRLRTTNMVERVNQELKRKGRLVRTWPNALIQRSGEPINRSLRILLQGDPLGRLPGLSRFPTIYTDQIG